MGDNEVVQFFGSWASAVMTDPNGDNYIEADPTVVFSNVTDPDQPRTDVNSWVDTRRPLVDALPGAKQIYDVYKSVPHFYDRFSGPMTETDCDQKFDDIAAAGTALRTAKDQQAAGVAVHQMIGAAGRSSSCGKPWLVGGDANSYGFGIAQAVAVIHGAMEYPGEIL